MMAARTRSAAATRARVALGLLGFLVVAAIVVFRRGEGTKAARQMQRLESEYRDLLAQKVTLKARLRGVSSRATVVREAERRLGLHVATEAQTRSLSDVGAR